MILLRNAGTPRWTSSFCIRHFLIPTYVNLKPHLRHGDVTAPFTLLFARYLLSQTEGKFTREEIIILHGMICVTYFSYPNIGGICAAQSQFFAYVSTTDALQVSSFCHAILFWQSKLLCMVRCCLQTPVFFSLSDTFQLIFITIITWELILYEDISQYQSKNPELFALH